MLALGCLMGRNIMLSHELYSKVSMHREDRKPVWVKETFCLCDMSKKLSANHR